MQQRSRHDPSTIPLRHAKTRHPTPRHLWRVSIVCRGRRCVGQRTAERSRTSRPPRDRKRQAFADAIRINAVCSRRRADRNVSRHVVRRQLCAATLKSTKCDAVAASSQRAPPLIPARTRRVSISPAGGILDVEKETGASVGALQTFIFFAYSQAAGCSPGGRGVLSHRWSARGVAAT